MISYGFTDHETVLSNPLIYQGEQPRFDVLVGNQLEAQFLLCYLYLNPLHVSSNPVLVLRRTTVLIQHLV